MPQIFYYTNKSGTPVAKWPGTSVRGEGGPRKVGQLYLGRVVNKEQNVFYKAGMGYYRFDTATQECTQLAEDEVPPYDGPVDGRERRRPVCCAFGDSYLLDRIVRGSGYASVIDAIPLGNRDTLGAMVQYYTLEQGFGMHAAHWYKASYASFLFPRANVASQQVSDLLRAIGSPEATRAFLEAHIRFLAASTDDPCCYVLVDNTCDAEIGFSLITAVQRSTGLPIFYEVIPGEVVDVSTIENVVRKLRTYGLRVVCVSGDPKPLSPSDMERLALSGIDFLARTDPTHDTHKRVLEEHLAAHDHTLETMGGHMLLTFVASFLHVMVKNRMGVLDTRYVAVPRALAASLAEGDGEPVEVALVDGTTQTLVEQDPVENDLGTSSVFRYTGMMAAEVFDTEIVPCVPTSEVIDICKAFGVRWPVTIAREGQTLTPLFKDGKPETCTRARCFATRPSVTDEQIEEAKDEEPTFADGIPSKERKGETTEPKEAKSKRRPGRPKGSKNKKTLEWEAAEREAQKAGKGA